METKHLQVTCAIIEHQGRILATQRGEGMSMAYKWEFPGGKINSEETPADCLQRELGEELGILVEVGQPLPSVTYCYPQCIVTLHPFVCRIVDGEIILHEHRALVWFTIDQIPDLDWSEADIPILAQYRQWAISAVPRRK